MLKEIRMKRAMIDALEHVASNIEDWAKGTKRNLADVETNLNDYLAGYVGETDVEDTWDYQYYREQIDGYVASLNAYETIVEKLRTLL